MKKKTTKTKKARKKKAPRAGAIMNRPGGMLQIPAVTDKTIDEYLHLEEKKLSPQHKAMFIKIATMYQLNPIKKEIYPIPFWNKKESRYDLTIIMAYDIFLKRAERTRKLAGWKVWTTGEVADKNLEAHIEIHRHDWKIPFTYSVSFSEYGKSEQMWLKIPKEMLKKVCIKSGFGKAFPELGDMPYIEEELPTAKTHATPATVEKYEKDITPEDKKPGQTKEPKKPKDISRRDILLATLRGSWNALKAKDKKKYDDKYYATALGMTGCEKTEDCTDAQVIELTEELDNERRLANG